MIWALLRFLVATARRNADKVENPLHPKVLRVAGEVDEKTGTSRHGDSSGRRFQGPRIFCRKGFGVTNVASVLVEQAGIAC
jgi:hypothetical protein